jgi:hypothetical protein
MSERDAPDTAAEAAGEPLLTRWSRLKAGARARSVPSATPGPAEPAHEAVSAAVAAGPDAGTPAVAAAPLPAPPVELPDIDQLGQDSDFSAFLTPGVDAELRKRALRKLFHSPKFNVFDGLDTYRDDFTSFPVLGDVVTADMQYHLERAAKELAARVEAAVGNEQPAAEPAAAIAHETPATEPAAIGHAPPPAPGVVDPALPPARAAAEPATARKEDDAEHGHA